MNFSEITAIVVCTTIAMTLSACDSDDSLLRGAAPSFQRGSSGLLPRQLPETPLTPLPGSMPDDTLVAAQLAGGEDAGDALLGDYSCRIDSAELPLGPFELTPFGCRIFRAEDGALKLGRTSQGIASLRGDIRNPTEHGFFITGVFKFPGNGLTLKVKMELSPGEKVIYEGRGLGRLNSGDEIRKKFILTIIRG